MDVGHDGVEVQRLWLDRFTPPEDEQLFCESSGSFGQGLDLFNVRPHCGFVGGLFGHESGIVHDGSQQVEVMGDPTGELSQALEPF